MSLLIFQVANAQFVTDQLVIGGDLTYDNHTAAEQAFDLVGAGVTHVLDVRQECDDHEWWSHVPAVAHRWDGIDDAGQCVPAPWFESITDWAIEAVEAGGVVLTHCHMGINRGPSAGYAVMLRLDWDPIDALAAIRAARPIANVWYAEDALEWHFARTGATSTERAATLATDPGPRLLHALTQGRGVRCKGHAHECLGARRSPWSTTAQRRCPP